MDLGCVCGVVVAAAGVGEGEVVFLVSIWSLQFLVPFRMVIFTFKTLGNNPRLASHFRETRLWINCIFYFRND